MVTVNIKTTIRGSIFPDLKEIGYAKFAVCEKYLYSSGRTGRAFSVKLCMNTYHPSNGYMKTQTDTRD